MRGEGNDLVRMLATADSVLHRLIHYYSQETVARNVAYDSAKPHFARVPQGARTCAFCSMLASRGFVYYSKQSAGELTKYHDHCDCAIVPEWKAGKAHIEGYNPDRLYAQYKAARIELEEHGVKHPSDNAIVRQMRKQKGNFTDSTGSSGERNLPEHAARARIPGLSEKDQARGWYGGNPVPKGHRGILEGDDETWRWRLADLESNYSPAVEHGDAITRLEISSVERLEKNGLRVTWITRQDGTRGANRAQSSDFMISMPGFDEPISVELKSLGARARNITQKINRGKPRDGSGDGWNRKPYYLIDIGTAPLDSSLRRSLEKFNLNNPDGRIRGLWVLHSDDVLTAYRQNRVAGGLVPVGVPWGLVVEF